MGIKYQKSNFTRKQMGVFYPSFRAYFEDADDLCDKVDRLGQIIDAQLTLAATSGLEDDVKEYRLNDGQTIINVTRRSVEEIMNTIRKLQLIRNAYINQINGRGMRLTNHEDTRFLYDLR